MESSNLRTFIFSLPSLEIQSPRSFCSTFRVGLEVRGTSYSQPLRAKKQAAAIIPGLSFRIIDCSLFMCFVGLVSCAGLLEIHYDPIGLTGRERADMGIHENDIRPAGRMFEGNCWKLAFGLKRIDEASLSLALAYVKPMNWPEARRHDAPS